MFSVLNSLEGHKGMMRVEDVCALLGLSRNTIYRMTQKREIPSVVLGGSRRYDPASIAVWLRKKDPTMAAAARAISQPVSP